MDKMNKGVLGMARVGKSRVTLKDIATECGYTANTVSRAMRGDDRLPLATRERITAIAKRMGYIPNILASSLRSRSTRTFSIIVNDIHNQHYSILLSEMDAHLRAMDYNMIIMCMQLDEELAESLIQVAISLSVDGIFYFPYHGHREHIDIMRNHNMPFVLIDRWIEGVTADSVRCDDELGGYLAGKHLLDLGHRRFLFVAGVLTCSSQLDRRKGFLRALSEYGLTEEAVRVLSWENCLDAIDQGTLHESLMPITYTGVVTFSDEIGYHVLNALGQLHVRVPQDVSVISFDHIRGGIPYLPNLTSIASDQGKLAETAVRALCNRVQTPDLDAQITLLPVRVYDEGTTAPPRSE
jgi:LacI family transcriptional regulator